ncbi:MAG: hypothetical protein LBF16_14335 [Pseudomonadales bacterium]|jgi:hypothetical protein|nr:hypothetical protein [Pseudomonadales bacterium]
MPRLCTTLLLLALSGLAQAEFTMPTLTAAQLDWLGARIYANECSQVPACLTSWNAGEEFPSLGIGHFIWYRAGQAGIYQETFPDLLRYLAAAGHALPPWIAQQGFTQPWPDRASFLDAREGSELTALRELLGDTLPEQTAFIVQRFHAAAPRLLAAVPPEERAALERKLVAVAASEAPRGLYALIDYVHFKGEGTRAQERYQGQGWGLLQVLQAMPEVAANPLDAFIASADAMLTRRVANAPLERGEERWLAGWRQRLATYSSADRPTPR